MSAQLPNPLRVLSKTQPREAEAMGNWLWAIGYWLWVLAMGIGYGYWYWLLNMGGKAAYPCLYTLHFTLYTISDSDPAFSL